MLCVIAQGADLEACNLATALTGAVRSGVPDKAALLLDQGAGINATYPGFFESALEAAVTIEMWK